MTPKETPAQMTMVHLDKQLVRSVVRQLPSDRTFGTIYRQIKSKYDKSPKDARIYTYESFRLDSKSKLLFFMDDGKDRLYIPDKMIRTVLEIGHDQRAHVGAHRTYEFLKDQIFIKRMWKTVKSYITYCPTCRLAKPSRTLPNGELQPIPAPPRQLHTFYIDFITGFPISKQGHDTVLVITDQLTKWLKAIVGGKDWTAKQ
ncbi:hypothetical protein VTL71DRAFT_9774 [Oculimacula yallundae]|uniref:Integrase zinc-binding domain-containing protein n=1 Tax=Oculimacula yallundae TaxID=86028 RepID=A0ABR4BTJ8_9HELO